MKRFLGGILLVLGAASAMPGMALANGGVCPRPPVGSEIQPPPDLFSQNHVLNVNLSYHTSVDDDGRTLFCFVTDDGKLSPTLHVNPGDVIKIHLTNQIPADPRGGEKMTNDATVCGDGAMTPTSVNMHFHGLNTSPKCHSDETIFTLVNSGSSFDYTIRIPADEPPGLYWYHPHVHGIASPAVQGGATGIIEVEGIQNIQPAVAGLPERFIVLRDEPRVGNLLHKSHLIPVPNWDVSINYVTVPFPDYPPAIIKMHEGQQEFWRVANAAANTIMDLKVVYDGVAQPLQIVAHDGVPTGSQDGTHQGTIETRTDILLPPASRVEFIVAPPSNQVQHATFETEGIEGGPAADSNPSRPFAIIQNTTDERETLPRMPERNGPPGKQRFSALADAKVTARRHLYFIEIPSIEPKRPTDINHGHGHSKIVEPVNFYINVVGEQLRLFDPNEPPAITTTRGAVEEWKIENRSPEVHEFHMHQIHFLVQEVNGVRIPKDQQQFYDTFQVPYYKGKGPFPYIVVKMDFRGAVVGDFVYHCHILDHEDGGMMAKIRVLPGGAKTKN
jgi:FtsP/CotA-like multicopper oxidase with cupredoxin domain